MILKWANLYWLHLYIICINYHAGHELWCLCYCASSIGTMPICIKYWKIYLADTILLTHWGRVTHICVSKLAIIGADNGLLPGRRQAIIWTNAGILLIEPLGTNFSEISIGILTFSFKKMHVKISSVKWRPFCLGLNVLIPWVVQLFQSTIFFWFRSLLSYQWFAVSFISKVATVGQHQGAAGKIDQHSKRCAILKYLVGHQKILVWEKLNLI